MARSSSVAVSVPAELAPHVQALIEHVEGYRDRARGGTPDFAVAERTAMELTGRLEGACVGAMLTTLDPTAPRVEVDGRTYKRLEQRAECTYYTMRSEVVLNRHLYRAEDVRNGPTVVPMDLRAGIVDGRYTPAAAVGFARLAQEMPSRAAAETCESLGVLPYSRSSHFRVGDAVGSRWDDIRDEVEGQLAAEMEIPDGAVAVSVAVDRVSMPMAEPREPTLEDIEAGVKNPITVAMRMAFSAVWTVYDRDGMPLSAVRYAHVPTGGAEAMERSLARDLDALLARRPDLLLVTLADGAPEMQSILDRAVQGHVVTASFVDFWHCIEHLSKAIAAAGHFEVADKLGDWKLDLLERDEAIEDIEAELRTWAMEFMLLPIEAMPEGLYDALTYVINNRDRLRYATAHAANLPVGSGTVEATCKTIVEVRMKRAGCRWYESGGQAVLGLRALATSEPKRWRAAMAHVLASYRHEVRMLTARERAHA